jgi:hypothetical protein
MRTPDRSPAPPPGRASPGPLRAKPTRPLKTNKDFPGLVVRSATVLAIRAMLGLKQQAMSPVLTVLDQQLPHTTSTRSV